MATILIGVAVAPLLYRSDAGYFIGWNRISDTRSEGSA